MNTKRPDQLHVYALRECLRAALRERCPELVEALDFLEAVSDPADVAAAVAACRRALVTDDARPEHDVDLALWREYAATEINADDTVAPWDFDDGSSYVEDEGNEPRWMYE